MIKGADVLSDFVRSRLLEIGNRTKNNLAFVSRDNLGGVLVHDSVVEEVALIASARQFWWIVLAATPGGYSTGR